MRKLSAIAVITLAIAAGCTDSMKAARKHIDIAQKHILETAALLDQIDEKVEKGHPAKPLVEDAKESNEKAAKAIQMVSTKLPGLQNKPDLVARVATLVRLLVGVGVAAVILIIAVWLWWKWRAVRAVLSFSRAPRNEIPPDAPAFAAKAVRRARPPP